METSRSFAFLSGIGAIAVALLELLLFLPDSSAGIYLQTILGVSNITLVQGLLLALIIALSAYPAYAIWSIVSNARRKFYAEIVGKKRFILGETVRFKAYYKGKLTRGLFTCKVSMPNRPPEFWPAPDTFQHLKEGDVGVLSGKGPHEAEWGFHIPRDYPTGEYIAQIGVWDAKDSRSGNSPVREKSASFMVLSPGALGTFAASGVTWVDSDTLSPTERQSRPALTEFEDWESDVKWELPSFWQPDPTFHQINFPDSQKYSKLHCKQSAHFMELTYEINRVAPTTAYYMQIGKYLRRHGWNTNVPDTIIRSPRVPDGPWDEFEVDSQGSSGKRSPPPVNLNDLIRTAQQEPLEVQLWINDAKTNRAVLGSHPIPIRRKV